MLANMVSPPIAGILGERVFDGVALFVRHRLAQIDARDFGAELGADARDCDAGLPCDDGATLKATDRSIHDEAIPPIMRGTYRRIVRLTRASP
jgi:hypothetical protein